MLPVILPILGAKLASWLKISTDDARYQSLYRTIENVLKALIAKAPGGAAALRGVDDDLIARAIEEVKAASPHVAKLGESDEALKTKIIARLPEAQAAVASA